MDLSVIDPAFFGFAAAAAFLAFLSTSTLGIGSALILTPALMVRLSAVEAVGVIAPAMLLNAGLTAWVHRKSIPFDVVGPTAAAAVPCCLVAASVAGDMPPGVIQVAIAAVIVLALGMERGLGKVLGGGRSGSIGWGAIAGTVGGIAGTFGPPVAISFLARGLTGAAFVGSVTAVGAMINVVRLPTYIATGVFTEALLPLAAVLAASGTVAVFAGKALLRRLDPSRFRIAVDVLLVVIAMSLVARAVRGGLLG
jgi:uncharacterized membrane protein YfcA